MKCANCGSENSPNAKFCRGCGNKLEVIEPALPISIAACPKCGNVNEPGGKFCTKCGEPAAAIDTSPMPPLTEEHLPGWEYSSGAFIPPPPPVTPLSNHATVQPAPAEDDRTKLVVGAVIAVLLLSSVGGGGYWYYKKQETEKAVAAEIQRIEMARELQQQRELLERQRRANAELQQQQQQQRANAELQQQQARSSQVVVTVHSVNCHQLQDFFVNGSRVVTVLVNSSQEFTIAAGQYVTKACAANSNHCGSSVSVNWIPGSVTHTIKCQ